ncbi:hypothetical protein AtEden1_Chr5g0117551 [Arabidopsis thaliana]
MLYKERLTGNACLVDIDLRGLALGFVDPWRVARKHGEIGTTLSYVVDHVFVMHFSKGNDLCMCEIELGLTVTGSLIQHDIVCYLGARLSLTSDYECKAGLGLCCEI